MKLLLLGLLASRFYFAVTHKVVNGDDKAGYQVLVTRDRKPRECHLSSIRSIPLHKHLRHSPTFVEVKPSRYTWGSTPSYQLDDILVTGHHLVVINYDVARECANAVHIPALVSAQVQLVLSKSPTPKLDVHALPNLVTGPIPNRINIVFFSDGYIAEEKQKFLNDATRLARAISVNQTYAPVAPLINFWGAFTPSNESGIGVGGKPKEYDRIIIPIPYDLPRTYSTVYGLYRDGTELRGIYTSKPEVAGAACRSMGDQCNYPLLLGNDPLYGGQTLPIRLGGDFTISTASVLNGPLVLRHELGHSIIWVGDEYDGSVYFGVNADNYTKQNENVGWDHWLPDTNSRFARPLVSFLLTDECGPPSN
ncbi:unnamed protein product [Rhizoctonia solani]|uniref:Uncharacterized protein n=1 Tax=Rhizoctonia solani TaxID=456999 RepID=A0A8H3H477_9AGAM|nr:unnamed protein product [Rhizoctonia solani]